MKIKRCKLYKKKPLSKELPYKLFKKPLFSEISNYNKYMLKVKIGIRDYTLTHQIDSDGKKEESWMCFCCAGLSTDNGTSCYDYATKDCDHIVRTLQETSDVEAEAEAYDFSIDHRVLKIKNFKLCRSRTATAKKNKRIPKIMLETKFKKHYKDIKQEIINRYKTTDLIKKLNNDDDNVCYFKLYFNIYY
nr:hypothetical protein Datr000021 [Darna trima granulovirus]